MKNNKLVFVFLFVLTAVSINYYYATFLPSFFKFLRLGFLMIFVSIGILLSFVKGKGFIGPIQLLITGMLLSIIISYLTWGQSIPLGFLVTVPYLLWPLFFVLLKLKVTIKLIERLVLTFGLIYIVCYFYQFLNPYNVLFNLGMVEDEYREVRGIIRIIFPGVGIFWLTTAIATTKTTDNSPYKIVWIILVILGFIIPIMQATRTFIVPTFLIYFYHYSKFLSIGKKVLIILTLFVGAIFLSDIEIPVIKGILDRQEQTMDDGKKDIRYIAATYFLTDFSPSPINKILGNGMGHERSSYGQFIKKLMGKGLFIPDIGIFGIYAYFGIIPVIAWILIGYKVFTYRIPKNYIYVKYYFFYVYFGSITGSTFYHIHYLISSIFAIYIFQLLLTNKNSLLLSKLKLLSRIELNKLREQILLSEKEKKPELN